MANKGYLEFPTLYYDYLYNLDVHKNFVFFDNEVIKYSSKDNFNLKQFKPLQDFFYKTLELGKDSILQNYRYIFFQGFEWHNSVSSQQVDSLDLLNYPIELITHQPRSILKSLKVIKNEVKNIINTFFKF